MTIYLDIIFIENLLMNYIILFATGFALKNKMNNIRLILSSLIGTVYVIFSYLKIIPIYSNFFMKILLSIIMIYIAFNPQTAKKMCKLLLLFYLASFVIGGCAFALLYFISPQSVTFKDGVLVGMYPIKVTVFAGAVGFTLIQLSFELNKRQLKKKDLICNAEIIIGDNNIKLKAYIDSGNTLIDPLTKSPVVIVEKSKLAQKIDIEKIIQMSINNKYKIRLIPFKSIGKQNGMLYRNKSR